MPVAISWTARIGVLIGCITFAFWDVDIAQLGGVLARFDFGKLGVVLVVSFVPYLAMAIRLRTLLRDVTKKPTLRMTFVASLFALGMNNLLPARLGELAKVGYLRQRCDASGGRLIGAVFWERFADVHALLLLSGIALLGLGHNNAFTPLCLSVAAVWAVLLWLRHRPRPFEQLIERLPLASLTRFSRDIMTSLRRGLGSTVSLEIALWTTVIWFFYALNVYWVVGWIAEIELGPIEVLAAFIGVSLGMFIPVSPGALGIYEAIFVLVLGWYGVPPEQALAAGLTAHMIQYIPTTAIAGVILARTDISWASFSRRRTHPPTLGP